MQATVQLDTRQFESAIAQAASALGKALPQVYREQASLFMRDLMNKRTPPKTKSQGLKVTRGHILNTVMPANEKWLNVLQKKHGTGPASGQYRSKRGGTITYAYAKLITSESELAAWHARFRNRTTGRTKYSRGTGYAQPSKAIAPKGLVDRYIKRRQANVGMAKGGWWPGLAQVLDTRAPAAWIRKHGPSNGQAIVNLAPGSKQSFTAINRSPWAQRTGEGERAVRDTMAFRLKQIPLAVERELKRKYSAAGFIVRGTDTLAGIISP